MCLATYGQIKKIYDKNGVLTGEVDFGGAVKEICLEYLADAKVGDYITAHENLAIKKLSPKEAEEVFKAIKRSCNH